MELQSSLHRTNWVRSGTDTSEKEASCKRSEYQLHNFAIIAAAIWFGTHFMKENKGMKFFNLENYNCFCFILSIMFMIVEFMSSLVWCLVYDLSHFGNKNPLSTSCLVNEVLMFWNGNYEFKIRFYCLKRMTQCFLAKPCMCNTLWFLRRLVVVWEQFHVWYFPQLPAEYFPREVFWEETLSWLFFAEKLPLIGMECFSEVFWEENIFWILFLRNKYLVICVPPLLSAKWRRPLGGSSWKLLELTSVSRFLAYVSLLSSTCNKIVQSSWLGGVIQIIYLMPIWPY